MDVEVSGACEMSPVRAFLHLYLANEHFESRMLEHGVAQKLVDLFSAGSAAYFLLQGVVCRKKPKSMSAAAFLCTLLAKLIYCDGACTFSPTSLTVNKPMRICAVTVSVGLAALTCTAQNLVFLCNRTSLLVPVYTRLRKSNY